MAVYVDRFNAAYGRMIMCHMAADTREELLAMADVIGLRRKWIQKAGTEYEHFDVSGFMRKRAVRAGAIEVTSRELVKRMIQKRHNKEHPCLPTLENRLSAK